MKEKGGVMLWDSEWSRLQSSVFFWAVKRRISGRFISLLSSISKYEALAEVDII